MSINKKRSKLKRVGRFMLDSSYQLFSALYCRFVDLFLSISFEVLIRSWILFLHIKGDILSFSL